MDNELDARKKKILDIIIKNYLATGEPVGSRTISKDPDLKVSSATIRNEMSDLEEMGYIEQPHTSAGRIPTDKGYRYYVDNMIQAHDSEIKEMRRLVNDQAEKTEKLEKLLQKAVKALSENTNYTSLISTPEVTGSRIKFIQLSNVSRHNVLAVIVLDGNRVKNQMLHVEEDVDNESILKLNILLNTTLNGLRIDQINLATIAQLRDQAGDHSSVVSNVLEMVVKAIKEDEGLQVYTSGATNILKYPELVESGKVSELLGTFENKENLSGLIEESINSDKEGIQVYIGQEAPVESLKDCSVVTATYDFGDNIKGMIGIVGPKRMDYQNVVDNLKVVKEKLDEVFHERRIGSGEHPDTGEEESS